MLEQSYWGDAMNYTDNLNLKKPEQTEFYNVDDFNDNADKLDEAINGLNTRVTPIENGGTGATTAGDACKNLGIFDMIYPVGSLYWTKNPTNPEKLFGGKWTQIKDKFILAAGDTYAAGSTGGEANVTLTIPQLPDHGHNASTDSVTIHGEFDTGAEYYVGNQTCSGVFSAKSNNHRRNTDGADNTQRRIVMDSKHTHTVSVDKTGGDQPHNNMPPYVTYYCWERTA